MKGFQSVFRFASFRPSKPLIFSNDRVVIYSHPKGLKWHRVIQVFSFSSCAWLGARVLLAPPGMGWFSYLFQTGLLSAYLPFNFKLSSLARTLVTEISLRSDGKTLEIETSALTRIGKKDVISIEDIVPLSENEQMQMLFLKFASYEIIRTKFDDMFYVSPEGFAPDKELLKAVAKGLVVDFRSEDKVDVIDV